jgi:predicted phage baseplate assembly protein
LPHSPALFDRFGEQLVPAVEVTLDDRPWFRQPHLHRSQPFDRHFVAVSDNDGRLWLQFGDGERGRAIELEVDLKIGVESARLAGADELRMVYRIGPNLAGNIDIGKLNEIAPRQIINDNEVELTGIEAVTNVTPGAGGRQPETLDAARLAIPASLRQASRLRAVTVEDYARVVELNVPGVERATARSLGEPFGTILVLVDPKDEAELTDELKSTIERVLERTRMVGREVLVKAAEAVPLDVELAVCVRPGFAKHEVKRAVLAALRPGDDERPGFFHPNRLTFGQDVELGDVVAEAQKVPGVLAVKARVFRRLRHEVPPVLPRIELGITEVARLDGDDLNPENGRLIVVVPGLDEVPDDLFKFESSELDDEEAAS